MYNKRLHADAQTYALFVGFAALHATTKTAPAWALVSRALCTKPMKEIYCSKCGEVVPILEDAEHEFYAAAHRKVIRSIQDYRAEHNVPLNEVPLAELREPALSLYEKITGYKPSHKKFDHIWHHHIKNYRT